MKNADLNTLMICAFRYALGRKTYITADISKILRDEIRDLNLRAKHVIKRDIIRAFETNNYGMGCDKEEWQKLLDAINAELGLSSESGSSGFWE